MSAAPTADGWGVEPRYLDSDGVEQQVGAATVERLRELIGSPPPGFEAGAPLVTRPGRHVRLRGEVLLEDGSTAPLRPGPLELPLGYHTLVRADGVTRQLIVSPGRCHLPRQRAWGWAVQLYAARSRSSWGIGNLRDLRALGEWAARCGAGFVLVNPLHAAAPTLPQEASPYLPSSRRFRNPLYLCVDDIPGAELVDVSEAATAARALNEQPLLDRDAVWRLLRPSLAAIFTAAGTGAEFPRWRAEQGPALEQFATWCALAERFGARWREWPAQFRRPDGAAVAQFRAEYEADVAFHAWLQWQLARQFEAAGRAVTVIQDLPVGFDPDGADAWAWQHLLAEGVTVGAPPDPFNRDGQDWALPPFVPWRLRQGGYRPFVESVRASIAAGGGLRIDHVMGLSRLWWIPQGCSTREGGYVRYPVEDLLDIVALESVRAEAVVVGEDLGTVEPALREAMRHAGMLSYRLLWFEPDAPRRWPAHAMGAVSTHDLPTVAGLWSGRDLRDQLDCGAPADEASTRALRARLAEVAALSADADTGQAVEGAYRALAQAPCLLLGATLEDALGVQLRPNMPGAAQRANWSLALPVPIEELETHPGALAVAAALAS
ncbi:MAG: 4-alpha-glucanotransferase [Jatrophihabitantaceae bacterium]